MQIFPQKTPSKSQWAYTDTLSRFTANCDQLPVAWAARSWPVEYQFNSTGHRMREWTELTWPTYMAVSGDSTALGTGLPLADTWSSQLAAALSLDLVNISEFETSWESQTQGLIRLIHTAPSTPRLAVVSWARPEYRQYVYKGESVTLGSAEPRTEGEHYWWINHQRSLAEPSDLVQRLRDCRQTVQCLCQRANIALFEFTSWGHVWDQWPLDLAQPRVTHPDTAKDLALQLEFLARDVELVKTTKEQRHKGWGDRKPQAHPGLYHQQRVLDSYWSAGIEIRY